MVKGCQKKIIHLRDTGSDIFEEAYFIIKPGKETRYTREIDMVKEARKVLDNNRLDSRRGTAARGKRRGSRIRLLSFLFGAISAAALSAFIFLLLNIL